jgi:1,5-anhydro-D-fructose reductase (1,5-anhydro-D-mannitol-forming)
MIMAPVGLGVIGCGWAASEIARVSGDLPQVRIVAAMDADPVRAAAFGEKAHATVHGSLEALLADPDVTACYVGLPHYLLAPTVEKALAAGKHVLCEKPLALDAAEARRLGALAAARGLKLCVFYELRRAGTVQLAKRLLAEGAVGQPRLIRIRTVIDKKPAYWGPPGALNWRASKAQAGGGVLMMNSVHQLDTLRYITRLEVTQVVGEIDTFTAPGEVEDAVSATLRLSNGALVSLAAAAHSPGAMGEETIEVDGTRGRLDLPDPFGDGPVRVYRNGVWETIEVPRPDSHALMLADFLAAVIDRREVPAGANDAAAALEVVNGIYRSAVERRTINLAR